MAEVSIVGLDLSKNVFQVHGACADGSVAFRRKLPRAKVLSFFAAQPPCQVAMERARAPIKDGTAYHRGPLHVGLVVAPGTMLLLACARHGRGC